MSCALKERFTDKIAKLCNDVCDSMIDEVQLLKEVSTHAKESLQLVQERLLTELSMVLQGSPNYMQSTPAPFSMKKIRQVLRIQVICREERWRADPGSVLLALHTLEIFELRDVDLFEFVKRCVMTYVDDPEEAIRGRAVKVACKVRQRR